MPTEELRGKTPVVQDVSADEVAQPDESWLDEYRIGPGDLLGFRSFDEPALSQELLVRYDGRVSLPLIPDVLVGGLTRDEAIEVIQGAYAEVFRDPQLSLTVQNSQSKMFYVMGDVTRPSQYPYERRTTVLQAINVAGGLRFASSAQQDFVSQQGTLAKAFVIRGHDETRQVIECDLRKLTYPGAHASDTQVYPEDFVYVPQGVNLVYVLGAVGRPTVFQLAEGQTLVQLLARAGSTVDSTARMRHIILLREVNDEETEVMSVNLRKIYRTGRDIQLRPGDVIYVPRRPLVRVEEFVSRVTGTISQVLNLYNLAWETTYTKTRVERLFDEADAADNPDTLSTLLSNTGDLGSIVQGYTTSTPQPPPIPELP